MSKVEDSAAIPEPGRKIPESGSLPARADEKSGSQADENKRVMNVEMALVQALQYLSAKSDNSQS